MIAVNLHKPTSANGEIIESRQVFATFNVHSGFGNVSIFLNSIQEAEMILKSLSDFIPVMRDAGIKESS